MGLYQATDRNEEITTSAPSVTVADVPSYSYHGCFTDRNERILDGTYTKFSTVDPRFCCDFCTQQVSGYPVCGVEDADNCWCGNTIAEDALEASPADCNAPCSGANSIQCGGRWRIHVYSATGVEESGVTTTATSTTSSTSTSSSIPETDSSGGLSGGAIAGIVIGGVVVLLLAGLFFFRRRAIAFFSKGGSNSGTNIASETEKSTGTQVKPELQGLEVENHRHYPQGLHQPSELDGAQQRPVELGGDYRIS